MHIAVCIVGFRNPDDIATCIEALARSSHADFEVVICENGGAAALDVLRRSIPRSLPAGQGVTLIRAASNLGYAAGVNLCMDARPSAEAWWVLNPDTQPEADAMERLCRKLAEGDCDAVGSTVYDVSGRVESRGGRWRAWLARAASIDHGASLAAPPDKGAPQPSYLSGASMLVGREFVERVGMMREDYFLYGEEVEWCLRAAARGARLGVAADAQVLHHQGTTTGSVSEVQRRGRMPVYLDERNKILITRDCFPHLLPIAAVGALVMLCLRFARRGAWPQLGYALEGWWSGVRNERGKPAWIAG